MRKINCYLLQLSLALGFIFELYRLGSSTHSLFGVTVIVNPSQISALCYTITFDADNSKIPYDKMVSYVECQDLDTVCGCIERSVSACNFKELSKKMIYVRIVYRDLFNYVKSQTEITGMVKLDESALINYHREDNYFPQELLDHRTEAFYFFFEKLRDTLNTDLEYQVIIGLEHEMLSVSFLTEHPKFYKENFLTKFSYKSRQYTSFSNNFSCTTPSVLLALFSKYLFQNNEMVGENTDEIINPCLPLGAEMHMDSNSIISQCDPTTYIEGKSFTFIGVFDLESCTRVLKELLFHEEVKGSKQHSNLAAINKFIFPTEKPKIVFYNEVFATNVLSRVHFLNLIEELTKLYCEQSVTYWESREIKCFHLVIAHAFFQVMESEKEYSINAILIRPTFPNVDTINQRFIYGDSRFGIRKFDDYLLKTHLSIEPLVPTSTSTSISIPAIFTPSLTSTSTGESPTSEAPIPSVAIITHIVVTTIISTIISEIYTYEDANKLYTIRATFIIIAIFCGIALILAFSIFLYKKRRVIQKALHINKL